jgi:APA family basic amino acid/polyamine antiporter
MAEKHLERTIGLAGATFLVVGYVIGASIFILPGSLGAEIGPAVWVAYLLAAAPAIVACFVMAQVGSAFPASGSLFVIIRDVLSPGPAFLYLLMMTAMAAVAIPLIAIGFADYFAHFLPGANIRLVSLAVVALFIGVNYLGMTVASGIQNVLVIGFLVALVIFGVGGVMHADAGLMTPLYPEGFSPVVLAAVTAFFSYAGVFIIAEVAGEIKNPGKTIPLAILLSFSVIIALYVLVPFALTGVLSREALKETNMAVVTASQVFLPAWAVTLVAVGALLAAATSVNGILMGMSRDFYKGAKSGMFPQYFGAVHPRFGTPTRAVVLIGSLALIGTAIGGNIVNIAQIAVMSIMVIQVITGIALWKLPARFPEIYAASLFKLSLPWLRVVSGLFIAYSVFFLVILSIEKPAALLGGVLFIAVGAGVYRFGFFGAGTRLPAGKSVHQDE